MRNSYIVPIRDGKVVLLREVIDQLNIAAECLLYAVSLREERSAVVSTIPPSTWDRAYRLIIYTASKYGSLSRTMRVLHEMGVNLLTSWSAATSPAGELCVTSIVDLPIEHYTSRLETFRESLEERLAKDGVLASSDVFEGKDSLQRVHLSWLAVLAALGRQHIKTDNAHRLQVEEWTLDLDGRSGGTQASVMDELQAFQRHHGERPARAVLITPDTEERYFRIALLPAATEFRRVSFSVTIDSETAKFGGFFQAAQNVLATRRLNVYSAGNVLTWKSPAEEMTKRETAEFSFVVDVREGGQEVLHDDLCSAALTQAMEEALNEHAGAVGAKVSFDERAVLVTRVEQGQPRCFFATNAKRQMSTFKHAWSVYCQLKALGLRPVNVEIATRPILLHEVQDLLRASPILVSLHLPEEKNTLAVNAERGDGRNHAASDWVLFEEAFMHGLGRQVFRLRHEYVRPPAYAAGTPEREFTDHTLQDALSVIAAQITAHMHTSKWRASLKASDEAAKDQDPVFLSRDLDTFLRSESKGNASLVEVVRGIQPPSPARR